MPFKNHQHLYAGIFGLSRPFYGQQRRRSAVQGLNRELNFELLWLALVIQSLLLLVLAWDACASKIWEQAAEMVSFWGRNLDTCQWF